MQKWLDRNGEFLKVKNKSDIRITMMKILRKLLVGNSPVYSRLGCTFVERKKKNRPFNVSHQHPDSNYYTLNFLMNRVERQARWNGALVHWFHGPPVALLSYPPHWFHRIRHAGCKTLFYSRRVTASLHGEEYYFSGGQIERESFS